MKFRALFRKTSAVACLGFSLLAASLSQAGDVAAAFEQFKAIAQPAAEQLGEKIVYQLDVEKRILKVGREMKINKIRLMTQVQCVKLDYMEPQGVLDGMASMPEPWVKVRCMNNERRVQVNTNQSVEGKEIEDLQRSEVLRFLILPCHRKSLKELLKAYAEFRKAAG